ncbi:MAG: hypothetical protein GEV11_13845 [Streptosporangiales bacterium]|nr:hypothetical protein [Streptosporangiales bacterium]
MGPLPAEEGNRVAIHVPVETDLLPVFELERLEENLVLRVERVRDGRSFSTRQVAAVQDGETIFNLIASFHRDESGAEFATPMARHVPRPEGSAGEPAEHPDWRLNRPVLREELDIPDDEPTDSTRRMWVRSGQRLPDDPIIHACALIYISDLGAVTAAIRALPGGPEVAMAGSLDPRGLHPPRLTAGPC